MATLPKRADVEAVLELLSREAERLEEQAREATRAAQECQQRAQQMRAAIPAVRLAFEDVPGEPQLLPEPRPRKSEAATASNGDRAEAPRARRHARRRPTGTNGGTWRDRIGEVMAAEPEREWPVASLRQAMGVSLEALDPDTRRATSENIRKTLTRMAGRYHQIEQVAPQSYRWINGEKATNMPGA